MTTLEEELVEFNDEEKWALTVASLNSVDGGSIDKQNASDAIVRWLLEKPGTAKRLLRYRHYFAYIEPDAGKRVVL